MTFSRGDTTEHYHHRVLKNLTNRISLHQVGMKDTFHLLPEHEVNDLRLQAFDKKALFDASWKNCITFLSLSCLLPLIISRIRG